MRRPTLEKPFTSEKPFNNHCSFLPLIDDYVSTNWQVYLYSLDFLQKKKKNCTWYKCIDIESRLELNPILLIISWNLCEYPALKKNNNKQTKKHEPNLESRWAVLNIQELWSFEGFIAE